MFHKVLVANRGEIALRVIRTLREMGIMSVAAFSEVDRAARFVQEADEAYLLGPAPAAQSYLSIDAILAVARQARIEAVHPGYGFLAENVAFAEAVGEAGITFIGPSPHAMLVMGDKVQARRAVAELGVPLVPGTVGPVRTLQEAIAFADSAGYPVAVKASGGGGGRGIRVVHEPGAMPDALEGARREALAYFNNPEIYLERYYHDPRHVEIQVLGDQHGTLVHLAERDCSVQRRHQKLVEESPAPAVDRALRERMGEMALRAARSVHYDSAGTVEFLLTRENEFYFLEMNTRIQVEHPVTEAISGIDLIREMVLAAAGEPLTVRDNLLDPRGHAIEIRVNAEDPVNGFRPTPGPITTYREPGGFGVRVDSGVYQGYSIPQEYDSLMAKLIVWAPDRQAARLRALRALGEFEVAGPATTIPFAAAVLRHPVFVQGDAGTTFVTEHMDELLSEIGPVPSSVECAVPGTRRGEARTFEVEVNRKLFQVQVAELVAVKAVQKTSKRSTSTQRMVQHTNDLVSPMHGTVIG
ncbi:MAG: acetyl-CoA carboxylase biotin carboxylase subunit, partial [Chloroflexota bacterium]|nr:acetyl-CoA carboxylase biotin carboxylase subunit [Chloroflexota bacterium]